MAGIKRIGDWKKAKEVLEAAPADLDQALQTAVLALANFYVGKIKQKIGSNIQPALSPFTMRGIGAARKFAGAGAKTLINRGDMRNSVTVVSAGKYEAFVGIPASSAKDVKIAQIHEEGRVIVQQMTPKQRAFLHATLGKKASKIRSAPSTGIIVIHIPARPFIKPVFDEYGGEVGRERFGALVLKNLRVLGKK